MVGLIEGLNVGVNDGVLEGFSVGMFDESVKPR